METNRLHQFHTIYQSGSLRAASELLGISHSGLSKSMTTLQRELNEELFIQVGRGVSFTDYGHLLAKRIPSFLTNLESLLQEDNEVENKILKIGSFEVFTTYFTRLLGPIFSEFDLDFHELVPGKMEQALINREIDIAITYEPIPIAGIEHLKVTEIEMGAFVKKGSFRRVDIQDIPFAAPLIPVIGAPTGIKGLDSWPDHKFKRDIKYRVDLMETAISLARNGHCAVFLPLFVAKLHNELVQDQFQLVKKNTPSSMKTVKRTVYIVKRNSTVEDSKIKKIAKYLRAL
jgi:DNA-binding transcriptional LysR family regulator